MKRYWYILLAGLCLFFALPIGAQEVSQPASDSLTVVSDTLVADSASLYPEWYVKPEIPKALRAPKHAPAAAGCPLDSILTFNIDSVLVEVTLYGYDAAGHTINQEVWTVKADGTRVGKEKKEYAYSGSKQTMTAVYEWDATTNNWKGTERFEYTYSGSKMTSKTAFIWLNQAWVADLKYTYSYDAAGRDATYFEYHRNTTNNQLEYFKGFEYVWIDATRKSLEIQYTEAINNVWTAGTKEEWAYDADDNMTLHADYTISTGNWIGSSKEEWAYTDNVLTMHAQYSWGTGDWVGTLKETWVYGGPAGQLTKYEKFGWYNNDWSMTLREIAAFDEAGHQTLIENYTGANGVPTGIKKEEYTFDANGIKTMTVAYAWLNNDWVGSLKETWTYGGPTGQLTLHEQFGWAGSDWSKTLKEETEYSGANIVRVENYTYANGVPTGTNKETWTYGGPTGQLTLHEQFGWANNDWSETLKEETEYSGANIVRIENYTYANGVTTGTQKVLTTYSGGKKAQILTFAWENGDWVNSNLETWEFNGPSGKQTKHEKSEWGGSDWTVVLQENTIYDGNTTTIENYERIAGVWTGTKKEANTVVGGKPTETIIYAWENGDWVNSIKEIWAYNSAKKETLHEKYEWENSDWKLTVQENKTYDGNNVTSIVNYELQAGVWTGTKKEEYTYLGSTTTKTQILIYQWINNDWMYQSKENWTYTSGKVTLHEKAGWNGEEWISTMREIADFDAAGNQIIVENYARLVTTGWTGLKKEEYTFEGGTKTSTVIYAWTNDDWVKSTKNEIGYQDGNTQVSEANYTWGGEAWVGSGNRTYTTKDSENRVIELLTQNWPSGATEWTNASLSTHKFDEEGDDILTYNGTWNGSRWAVSSMTRLDKIFDEKDRQLLKASWKCSADSNWIGVEKDTAKYSATDKLLYRAKYKGWKNNDWVPVSRTENTYDAADRITLEESYNYIANDWRGVFRYESVYDAQGRKTSYASYNSWNTSLKSWVGTSRQDYEFYKNYTDKYKSKTTYGWKNNQWSPTFSYLYTYDSSDREIEQIVRSYSSNAWKNKNKYVTKYNGSTKVGEYEYAWSNNQWALRSQHEWYYDADAQAKLRREIIGTWTNAGVKSYEDNHYDYACDIKYYTINFKNYDGTVLFSTKLPAGETPVYNGSAPTRPADDQYTYTYTGWDKPIVAVTGDATYTATYSHAVNSYTITWLNDNDSQIDQTTVEYGVVPAHANPTKQATAEFTYTFTGWTPEVVSVTGDATYKATFSATKNSYTITWLDEKGSLLDQTIVEYGVVPTHDDVTKAATDEYTYTFTGWTPDTVAVTGDATYQATFTATTKSYTITWLDENGIEINTTEVAYGVVPTHADPTKDNTAEWTYTFTGWTPEVVSVTGDATYKATFSATKNSYTITWLDEKGSLLDQTIVEYGVVPTHDDIAKAATDQYTYTFTGWAPDTVAVTGDATYQATFTATTNTYTITWLDENGIEINTTEVEYGVVPTHDDPTKAATEEYIYIFAGWTPDTVAVTGDATYQATYTQSKKSYIITWLDENGIEIDKTEVAYGVVPTHEDPTKDNTAEWTYTFTGWTPDTVAVTGDATYQATFSATKNSYTITWLNDDNSLIDETHVEYGVVPTHEDAVKANTAEWTYTFKGWDPAVVAVTGVATYTAQFDSVKNSYTITWLNDDNSLIDESDVEYGVVPTHDDAIKAATDEYTYTFKGWNPAVVAVTGVATYTAQFDSVKNSYTITWLNNDNSLIDETHVEYGDVPTHEDAVKANTAEWTYTFKGWDPAVVAVTGVATYTAQFDSVKNSYTITWLNDDNSLIDESDVEYGVVPTHDDAIKAATDEYTYTFKGWDPAVVAVTGVATYTAQFDSVKNSYTITWLNDDNSLIDETHVEYGVVPTHDDAVKAATDEYTYTFKGWNPAVVAVTGVATYTAQFDSVKNSYTITWLNDDHSLIDETYVEYGVVPTHEDAVKANTAEWTYTFKGWDVTPVAVVGDATYTATFDSIKNSYTVTWLNDDGSQIDQTTVEYGLTPAHANINKENTAEWTYTFVGWTPEITEVTGDATYTATFDSIKNNYTVIFYDEDGTTVLDSREWEYGATPTCAEPTKPATQQYIYTFSGWTPEVVAVTGEAAYTATFAVEEIRYHVSVSTDDAVHGKAGFVYADSGSSTLLTEGDILNGTWIELQATADNEWHFDHWSDGDTSAVRQVEVTSDMQFTAYFAINCGDYPSLPVVCLYDWLLMLDVRSIHEMGYSFGEEDVTWYRVHGEPDKLSDGASADDELLGTGYSFTLNQSLVNTGDYYAMVDVSKSSSDMLCTDMMRSKIVHYASSGAAAPPILEPALVRPNAPQRVQHLNPEAPTVISIYDIAGHLLRTFSEEGVEQINLQAEGVAGCYQIVVQNGDLRTVLRYIVVK